MCEPERAPQVWIGVDSPEQHPAADHGKHHKGPDRDQLRQDFDVKEERQDSGRDHSELSAGRGCRKACKCRQCIHTEKWAPPEGGFNQSMPYLGCIDRGPAALTDFGL